MTCQKIIAMCARHGNPLFLSEDGKQVSARKAPPPALAEAISRAREEVRYWLARGERDAISQRLREVEESQGAEEEIGRLRARLALLETVLSEYQSRGLATWYGEGWALVRSELLSEIVIIVRDRYARIPSGLPAYLCYRFAEVRALEGRAKGTVKAVHAVKKTFKGEIFACDKAGAE